MIESPDVPKIKLCHQRGSCSHAPYALLLEAGLDFDAVEVDAPFTKEYLQINPKARVPILILDDKKIITEIPAILTFISHLVPERRFLGSSSLENVRVYEWMVWLSGTLHGQAFALYWRPQRFIDNFSDEEAAKLKEKGFKTILNCFDMIEENLNRTSSSSMSSLRKSAFAVGDSLTAVDVYLAVFYRWGKEIGVNMNVYPKFTELWNALLERPAFVESLKRQAK
jgi:glutathione S-transferase